MKRLSIIPFSFFILLLVACQQEAGEAPQPGKTPLTLGSINVTINSNSNSNSNSSPYQGEVPAGRRGQSRSASTTAFFNPRDVLTITVTPDGLPPTRHTATWSDGGGFSAPSPVIYLEDVYNAADDEPTATITATFGDFGLVPDQSTEEKYHAADRIAGALTVNLAAKTLECATMTREHAQLIIQILPGEGWAANGSDFLAYFNTSTVALHTTDGTKNIDPLAGKTATGITLTAILPADKVPHTAGAELATITPSADPTQVLKLNTAIAPRNSYSYTITASLDNKGTFTTPTVTLKEWQQVADISAPAYTDKELERFMNWAQRMTAPDTQWNEDFTLQADIDLSGIGWTPIGATGNRYSGTFDGGGHTISGLYVDTDAMCAGLFGRTSGATLKNLTLKDARITSTDSYAGALVGGAENTLIIACRATDCRVEAVAKAGLLIGGNNKSTLIACHVSGGTAIATYNGNGLAAGLVGENVSGSLIACVAEPDAISSNEANIYSLTGAIAGTNSNADITTPAHINTCYWRTYTFHAGTVAKAVGDNSATSTPDVYELTTPGIPQAAADAMNTAIDTWNADNNNACQWKWTTTELTKQ